MFRAARNLAPAAGDRPHAGRAMTRWRRCLQRAARAPGWRRRSCWLGPPASPGRATAGARRSARRAAGGGAERARPGLHQARPDAVDPLRPARRADGGRPVAAAGPAGALSRRRGARPRSRPSSAGRSASCSPASTTTRCRPPRSPRCISRRHRAERPRQPGRGQGAAARHRARLRPRPRPHAAGWPSWSSAPSPSCAGCKPVEVVETFAATVRIEMDLRLEAAAAAELAENFAGDPTYRVPAVDWRRTGAPGADPGAARRHPRWTTARR